MPSDGTGGAKDRRVDAKIVAGPVEYLPMDDFPQPAGAEAVFLGRTRIETHPEYGPLKELEYEAYEPMAERVLHELADEAISRFNCRAVRLHHAIGSVPVGGASVLVQVACGHRHAAFEACRFLIDALKERVPIWKKEIWLEGSSWSPGSNSPAGSTA